MASSDGAEEKYLYAKKTIAEKTAIPTINSNSVNPFFKIYPFYTYF